MLARFAGALDGGDALGAEGGQHVLFRREIIEEGSFAHVGGFGDVLDGGFEIAAFGEEPQRGAKQTVADFGAMAFAAARVGQSGVPAAAWMRPSMMSDLTDSHIRL